MAPISNKTVWEEYLKSQGSGNANLKTGKDASENEREWFELELNGHILKYAIIVFGSQPPAGYPLYIGLHGGGTNTNLSENDGQWWGVFDGFYRTPVMKQALKPGGSGAVFVAARGISALTDEDPRTARDTSDLHSQPESYYLLQRMIANLLLPQPNEILKGKAMAAAKGFKEAQQLVDSNKVYLLGFSAGGDGVYQVSTKIADRFAAVLAGGGHPNDAKFTNLANLPICLQCGERDIVIGYNDVAIKRAVVTVDTHKELNKLDDNAEVPFWYRHECHIVKGGLHNEWTQPDQSDRPQKVLANLPLWSADPSQPQARDAVLKNINPVEWVSQFVRNPLPEYIVWDISSRPPHLKNIPEEMQPQRFFHWLYIRNPESKDFTESDIVTASYRFTGNRTEQWFELLVSKASAYLGLLVSEDGIGQYLGNYKLKVLEGKDWDSNRELAAFEKGTLPSSESLQLETLKARGDPNFVFSKMLYFERNAEDNGWNVKAADSLKVPISGEANKSKLRAKL